MRVNLVKTLNIFCFTSFYQKKKKEMILFSGVLVTVIIRDTSKSILHIL
jgi:hypothetical protein